VKHVLLVTLSLSSLVGCHQDKEAEGPMERAGKHVDDAAEKTGRALEKAAHKTGEAFEKAGKKLKGSDAPAPSPKPAE
jgi:hypothetical protein